MSSSGDLRPPPDRFFGPLNRATKRPRSVNRIQVSFPLPSSPLDQRPVLRLGEVRKLPELDIRRIAKIFIR